MKSPLAAVTIEVCKVVEKMAEERPDQILMLGFMRRYDPSYAYAKKKIQVGEIGIPYLVKAVGADTEALFDSGLCTEKRRDIYEYGKPRH